MRQDFGQTFSKRCTFSLYVKQKSTRSIFDIIKDNHSFFSPSKILLFTSAFSRPFRVCCIWMNGVTLNMKKSVPMADSVYFEYEETCTHGRLLHAYYALSQTKRSIKTSEPVYADQTIHRTQFNVFFVDTLRQTAVYGY